MTGDRNGLAMARARAALAKAGLDPSVDLQPLSSVTNEVWLAGKHVVRVNRHPVPRLWREATLATMLLPAGVGCPPIVAYGGIIGADWMITERLPGQVLARCWPAMSVEDRRRATRQLADKLRMLHRYRLAEPLPEISMPHMLASSAGPGSVERLMSGLDVVQDQEFVDPVLIVRAKMLVRESLAALDPVPASTLIHGDIHFENILWDGERITGLLDFEWARAAAPDLELDVFLRFCGFPFLHVAADYEQVTLPEDYADVPRWLAEDYPELFAHPRLRDRLRVYSIAYDVRELLLDPPTRPVDELSHLHPYHRLADTVDGRGHIDLLDLDVVPGGRPVPLPDRPVDVDLVASSTP
ncbi:MAG TPA: aminoglycoside phosphotransferase family protein [Acidimicrobiales bacterium]|nr:aminoglycoside phosphotransferase family protein [Acidimicrobiales bacterium]